MFAGAGSDPRNNRRPDGLLVFHHNDGIPDIAQLKKRLNQLRVIVLMQSNRRLIENIQSAGQSRTKL